jgi:hypothetical protein
VSDDEKIPDTDELKVSFEEDVLDPAAPSQKAQFVDAMKLAPPMRHRASILRQAGKPSGIASAIAGVTLGEIPLHKAERFAKKAFRSDRKRKQEKASRKRNRRRK